MAVVLLVGFHYPPCAVSSGVQRTLSFSIHLPEFGWNPVVMTADPRVYERTNDAQLGDIDPAMPLYRSRALDAVQDLSFRGKHWARLAIPDRWRLWYLTGVPCGLRLIRRHGVDVIWSTYPIATAHSIAATLCRLSQRPWVADFRDPMVEYFPETDELFPTDSRLRNARLRIERQVAERASNVVFCTETARQIFAERHATSTKQGLHVVSNGYEEAAFEGLKRNERTLNRPGKRLLLHSGTIYSGTDRDPTSLFRAVSSLKNRRVLTPANFELRLRDPSKPEYFRDLARREGVEDLVTILPPLPYRPALQEMASADALLILQGYTSNPAIPAKLYEYLRAQRPIVGLVHPNGETSALLRSLGIATQAPLTDQEEIARLLVGVFTPGEGSAWPIEIPPLEKVERYSRRNTTRSLADILHLAARSAPATTSGG